ncbi:hypothetical protein SEUCBS139899_007814 [Sporothrix eucalyptigena]|uniref:Clock-controlled protein 6 n=1 Tax=Sporothrix eucalyptigena TaxID=1812306 RepID=A0ABP0APW7_9PEZI
MQMFKFLAPLAGFAAVAAAGAADVTTTIIVTDFTTYCPEPTTLVFKNKTITVTSATTLTITDCPCTLECYTPPPITSTSYHTVPYSNKTTTVPPVIVTITPSPTTVLQGVSTVTQQQGGGETTVTQQQGGGKTTVTQQNGQTTVITLATTKPVTSTTPVVVGSTTTTPAAVVTAGANKVSGVAAFGLAVGMAALVL